MDKCLSSRELDSLLDQSMPQSNLAGAKRHLRLCDTCAARLVRRKTDRAPLTDEVAQSRAASRARSPLAVGLEPNVEIGDYRIKRRLGSGGMGIVYQAQQISLQRPVALKVLPAGPLTSPSIIERFHREARAVAKLRHPSIVSIYEERVEQNLCYYAMELIEGQSLDTYIQDYPRPGGRTKSWGKSHYDGFARIIAPLAEALDYAHQQGVIHRDIKPSNVMVTPDGRPMLMDFGIARLLDDPGMTMTSTVLGTPLYMSPEQIGARPGDVDVRTDVYSLGATLYELITGQPLYEGLKTRQQIIAHMLRKPAKRPRQIDERIPVDLETICIKALEFEPAGRYQSAAAMADDLHRYLNCQVIQARPVGPIKRFTKLIARHRTVSALIVVALVAAVTAAIMVGEGAQNRRIRSLLPELQLHVDQGRFFQAYLLAREWGERSPNDPVLAKIWPQISHEHNIVTTPADAEILMQDYFDFDSPWISLGSTPIRSIRLPYGINRFRVTGEGHVALETAIVNRREFTGAPHTSDQVEQRHIAWTLHHRDQIPADMVWIPGIDLSQGYLFHARRTISNTQPFLIDKYEVTNRAYKAFVDALGYENRTYWQETFVKEGVTLTWKQALEQFVDQTGRPGPGNWQNGNFPPQEANYPVSGISWFEAAAYARYCGKDLPTAFHWLLASSAYNFDARITVFSNFSGVKAPVGTYQGMGRYGVYDMAGNVREWCSNTVVGHGDQRCIMGGTHSSPHYTFRCSCISSPWDRSTYNGLRCVQYVNGKNHVPKEAFEPLEYTMRDWEGFSPHSPEAYENYRQTLYGYERTPLNAVVESVDHEMDICRRERVTFDAVYANDRVVAYLHLPTSSQPPYQTVVWYPGSDAHQMSWDQYCKSYHDILKFLMRKGRAVVIPMYNNTYDRRIDTSSWDNHGLQTRNLVVQQAQDLARTIDYLETRADIDSSSLAYVGYVWGAICGTRVLAYEERVKTGIFLYSAYCACTGHEHPSVDPARFAPFIKIPILMINGRDAVGHTYEAAQKPMYNLLGTPENDKKLILFPGGHTVPVDCRAQHDEAIQDWLDKYLGPVTTIDP